MSQLMKCNKELDELFYDGHLIARTSQVNSRYDKETESSEISLHLVQIILLTSGGSRTITS